MNREWAVETLIESMRLLASDPENQVGHLAALGLSEDWMDVDEIALEFEDAYGVVPRLATEGLISADAHAAIDALDIYLKSFSGSENRELWTADAVRQSAEWARVRVLAAVALESMIGRRPGS